MQVAQIVKPGVRQGLSGRDDRLVVAVDQLGHQRGDGIGVKRLAPFGDEDQTIIVCPGSASREAFFGPTGRVGQVPREPRP